MLADEPARCFARRLLDVCSTLAGYLLDVYSMFSARLLDVCSMFGRSCKRGIRLAGTTVIYNTLPTVGGVAAAWRRSSNY